MEPTKTEPSGCTERQGVWTIAQRTGQREILLCWKSNWRCKVIQDRKHASKNS